jgi:hypothetical protein
MRFVLDIKPIGNLHVVTWLHDAIDPTHAEWQVGFDQVLSYQKQARCETSQLVMLVVTDGGAPGAVERTYMAEHIRVPSAVITTVLTNPIKRGIATAIGWTNPRFLFTEPKQWQRALDHLEVGAHGAGLWSGYGELQKRMPLNHTLELISKACQLPSLAGWALKESSPASARVP